MANVSVKVILDVTLKDLPPCPIPADPDSPLARYTSNLSETQRALMAGGAVASLTSVEGFGWVKFVLDEAVARYTEQQKMELGL